MNKKNNKAAEENDNFRCGFVTIFGRANTGKSTLLNSMLGNKLSITSNKPQTTRNKITGILNRDDSQIIFIDTPGIGAAKGVMGNNLVRIAYGSLNSADIILVIIDALAGITREDEKILSRTTDTGAIVYLVINKIDLIGKQNILLMIESMKKYKHIKEFIPVSAKKGTNLERLIACVSNDLPVAHRYFDDDLITDRPEEFVFSEFIREKIYRLLKQEVPYSTLVEVNEIKEGKNEVLVVSANIFVEKESQKGIIVGKNGEMIKKIGTSAREDIEEFTGCKVFLDLHVRVKPRWTEDIDTLHKHGYTTEEN